MPSSWSESNRLHSSNVREESADSQLDDFFEAEAEELFLADIIEENYEDAFSRFDEPLDRYLDAAYEDRYYLPEADFDIY